MRFLEKTHDGGKDSGVTGYFLIEIKSLFSIVLINFQATSRDAYHNHAFNALTIWLKGHVIERKLTGETSEWSGGRIKYTPRDNFHRVDVLTPAWALCFRGPWTKEWNEVKDNKLITLTHGRKIVKEEPLGINK